MRILCLIVALFLIPTAAQGQKWNVPLIPVADSVPNMDWYEEVTKLTKELKEQGELIKELSEELAPKGVENVSCNCAPKWEELEKRLSSLEDRLTKLEKPLLTPPGENGKAPLPKKDIPIKQVDKVTITMHTFANGSPCRYCDIWEANEAPKLRAMGYTVLPTVADVTRGKVPLIVVCVGDKVCQSYEGAIKAETIVRNLP